MMPRPISEIVQTGRVLCSFDWSTILSNVFELGVRCRIESIPHVRDTAQC